MVVGEIQDGVGLAASTLSHHLDELKSEELVTVRKDFFFNDTATTEIYTLSLHDALPIYSKRTCKVARWKRSLLAPSRLPLDRSEEHTSELQSPMYLVCRLLLEKTSC